MGRGQVVSGNVSFLDRDIYKVLSYDNSLSLHLVRAVFFVLYYYYYY